MDIKSFKKIKLPDKPGVYIFKRSKQILYIGKATSLKNRVKSYMSKSLFDTRGPLLEKMMEEVNKVDWQDTDSVLEALILEAELIKKYQPKYNTKEKSDKSFNYVCVSEEKLPKVLIVRGSDVKHRVFNKVYGPYTSGGQLKEALKIIRKIFPFLDDKSKNYLEFYKQINLIPDLNDTEIYLQNIKNIKLFFQGKKKEIFRNLKKEMHICSSQREFEKAGEIKRQLFALEHINDVALLKNNSLGHPMSKSENFRIEAYDIAHMGGKNMVGVMTVVTGGEVEKNEYKKFSARGGSAFDGKTVLGNSKSNDTGALKEVLERRLAHKEWAYPDLIVVDGGVAQMNVAKNVLKKMNLNISTVSVLKDDRHKAKDILGDKKLAQQYEKEILLANSEAHRFAINYHKKMRNKNFLR